jgi:hypothetical protein
MKLPAFDKNGCISMSEVMAANAKDFEQFGVHVEEILSSIKKELSVMESANYSKEKASYFHELLDEYATANGRMRKPFYQYSGEYCFYYNLFCQFVTNSIYYKMDEPEEQKMDQEILDCEIRLVKNPNSFYGRSNDKLVQSYKGHTVTIYKGCSIKTDGIPNIAKKNYNVVVHHVLGGHYYRGVQHPAIVWGGKNGWNEAYLKDIFQEK